MKFLVGLILSLFVSNVSYGQYIGRSHSSTLEEGILRGSADVYRGAGRYLEGLGNYEVQKQQSEHQKLLNRAEFESQYRENKEYIESNKFDYLDFKEKQLDNAERRHALKAREEELIYKGVLPSKQKKTFIINGKAYHSLEEYNGSYQHQLDKLTRAEERTMKEIRDLMDKRKEYEAVVRLSRWGKLNEAERYDASIKSKHPDIFKPDAIPPNKEIEMDIESHMKVLSDIRDAQYRLKLRMVNE